MTPAFQATT